MTELERSIDFKLGDGRNGEKGGFRTSVSSIGTNGREVVQQSSLSGGTWSRFALSGRLVGSDSLPEVGRPVKGEENVESPCHTGEAAMSGLVGEKQPPSSLTGKTSSK